MRKDNFNCFRFCFLSCPLAVTIDPRVSRSFRTFVASSVCRLRQVNRKAEKGLYTVYKRDRRVCLMELHVSSVYSIDSETDD